MSPPKARHHVYNEEAIRKCLDEIAKGSSAKAASIKYGIPRSTLRFWMSSKWKNTTRKGPSSVLSSEEEGKLVNWIVGMQQRGFHVQRCTLLLKVKEYLTASPRKTPFKNDCPGRKWFNSFMRRNPTLSVRTMRYISETEFITATETENPLESVQLEPSCSKDLAPAVSGKSCSQLSISGNNPPSANLDIPINVFSDFVPIHKDKIKEAVAILGSDTLLKMRQKSNNSFTREERIIQYFYNEFIQLFTSFESLPIVLEFPNNEPNLMAGFDETATVIGELLIDTEKNKISASEGTIQQEITHTLMEPTELDRPFTSTTKPIVRSDSSSIRSSTMQPVCIDSIIDQAVPNALPDITNIISKTRKTSISKFLNFPPTPRRSGKHRNYTKKYFPVLTAGERIAEIRKGEEEKLENERKKKIRAAEQAEAKEKAEKPKQEKADKRKQKKVKMLQQKGNRTLKRTRNMNDENLGISKPKKIKAEDLKHT